MDKPIGIGDLTPNKTIYRLYIVLFTYSNKYIETSLIIRVLSKKP